MLQLIKREDVLPKEEEHEIVLASEGGNAVILRLEEGRVTTLRKAAIIAGRPVEEYARLQALRMIRNG